MGTIGSVGELEVVEGREPNHLSMGDTYRADTSHHECRHVMCDQARRCPRC